MHAHQKYWAMFIALAIAVIALLIPLALYAGHHVSSAETRFVVAAGLVAAALAIVALLAIAWTFVELALFRPMRSLSRAAQTMAASDAEHAPDIPAHHLMGELPRHFAQMTDALLRSRRELAQAIAAGAAGVEEQKSRLETILREIDAGVIVCDSRARILLYNTAAEQMLGRTGLLGLGRPVFVLFASAPLRHALDSLRDKQGDAEALVDDIDFTCAALEEETLLHCRMTLLPADSPHDADFLLTFEDVTIPMEALRQRDTLLREVFDSLRRPIANLRVAAENLAQFPQMAVPKREQFQDIVTAESQRLATALEELDGRRRALSKGAWTMTDLLSTDLAQALQRRLADSGIRLTPVGIPLWLRCDSHCLVVMLQRLIEKLRGYLGETEFDFEPLIGDMRIYLDIAWRGAPVPASEIEQWLDEPLPATDGQCTVQELLQRHGSDLWSQTHRRAGYSVLRLPVPASGKQWQPNTPLLPPRPEFYDFSLFREGASLGPQADTPLEKLEYVVFDTETTGLRPSHGDEIVSIAGVRIVGGRLLTDDTFERLVNPRRSIPKASIRFHGITDEQVRDQDGSEVVLPQFRRFIQDAVLVGHNAAFDMKFLKLKEAQCGVRFDNPVLDTLLLSVYLHPEIADQTLDGMAHRFGIEQRARHTASGDARVTAEIFLVLLDLLRARGVVTLAQAIEASEKMTAIRKQQQVH
jgi:DNA polymerase-3 subunit epsilon